ncbi:hypothetical protein LSH36_1371g00033 [Paralvinella palmiformis]|uniref:Uncharacterized protein n=1 Tax=Paralvinella palmiformis TaxID=53620 RepID=A0AAD9IU44_9ANNE|nr:hypothetical protein LSH36_1371g00033 [Paralvinella palmiformis]
MDVFYLRLHQILGSNDKITRIAFKDNDKLFVKVVKKVFDIRHIAGVDYHEETRKVKERNIEKAKHVLDADIKLNDLIKELVSYYMNRKIREYKIVTNEDQPVDNFRMWINKILVPDFDISSFVSDFKNPLVFGAILDKVEPGLWKDWRALTVVNKESTVDVMMKLAEDRLNIKPVDLKQFSQSTYSCTIH